LFLPSRSHGFDSRLPLHPVSNVTTHVRSEGRPAGETLLFRQMHRAEDEASLLYLPHRLLAYQAPAVRARTAAAKAGLPPPHGNRLKYPRYLPLTHAKASPSFSERQAIFDIQANDLLVALC